MPSCSVKGCFYGSVFYQGEKRSVFRAPEGEHRDEWIRRVPFKSFKVPAVITVCEVHFEPSCIKRTTTCTDASGNRIMIRTKPRLVRGSFPTIFPPEPPEEPPIPRRHIEQSRFNLENDAMRAEMEAKQLQDVISGFEKFKAEIDEKLAGYMESVPEEYKKKLEYLPWEVHISSEVVVIYQKGFLAGTMQLQIVRSVALSKSMVPTLHYMGLPIAVPLACIVSWQQLANLLTFFGSHGQQYLASTLRVSLSTAKNPLVAGYPSRNAAVPASKMDNGDSSDEE